MHVWYPRSAKQGELHSCILDENDKINCHNRKPAQETRRDHEKHKSLLTMSSNRKHSQQQLPHLFARE